MTSATDRAARDPGPDSRPREASRTLVQFGTLARLSAGDFDGHFSIGDVAAAGDLGLGTFESMDGELVQVDGVVYRVGFDGAVARVGDDARTPFAATARSCPSIRASCGPIESFEQLDGLCAPTGPLGAAVFDPYAFYAIHIIGGHFRYVKTRSVACQYRPYPPLAEVVARQAEFEFTHVHGDMVGFYSPEFARGIAAPGWHLHFITQDRATGGGHVLDFATHAEITLDLTRLDRLELRLPNPPVGGRGR